MPFCYLKLRTDRTDLLPRGYPIEPKTIGEHIRKHRLDLGLTQTDVAAQVGVTVNQLTGWETGRTEPRLRFYPALIAFLGYDPRPRPDTLADRIRYLRQVRGWTTRDLARRIGVDPSTVQAWERLGVSRRSRLYDRLVRILGIAEPAKDAP